MQTKKFSLGLFFLFIFNSYSQINFEKGYFINNNGEKIDCLIKNLDWNSNPTSFDYKLTENSEALNNTITNTQEFGITNISKYKRAIVKIDRSKDATAEMNYNRYPVFTEETLFLKTLISGKASLFSYVNGSLSRYFFAIDNSNIEQLVYKTYYQDNTNIQQNVQYKQQLLSSLICDKITMNDIEYLEYQKDKLANLFLKYNNCTNSAVEDYEPKTKRDEFNISIRPGISASSFSMSNNLGNYLSTNFGNKTTFRLGMEFEYIFPFNKNKWALFVEPTYQYFKAMSLNNKIDYKTIDAAFGVRHYMFLNNKSKLFVNAALVKSFGFNSKINFIEIRAGGTLNFGFGYKYNNKYNIEYRYSLAQDLLINYLDWRSGFNTSSLVFGYTLF